MSDSQGLGGGTPTGQASGTQSNLSNAANSQSINETNAGAETNQPENTQQSRPIPSESPKKIKLSGLKIKGKEQEVELEEPQLKEFVQKAMGADLTFQEAAQLRKEAERRFEEVQEAKKQRELFEKKLKENPIAALLEQGIDPSIVRQHTENWLLEQIKADEASPHEKALKAKEQELERKQKELKEIEEKRHQELLQAQTQQFREEFVSKIQEALEAHNLPKSAEFVRRISEQVRLAKQRGYNVSWERAGEIVKQDFHQNVKHLVSGITKQINEAHKKRDESMVRALGDQLSGILGEETVLALQRYGILKFRSTQAMSPPLGQVDTAKVQTKEEPKAYMSREDYEAERQRHVQELERQWRAKQGVAQT